MRIKDMTTQDDFAQYYLSTSPHYFCRKWIGVTKLMRIQISMLGIKGLKSDKYES